jgi:hypothetical protein
MPALCRSFAADRRIAAADDFHVAVERPAGIDIAARVDRGRDLELRAEEIDRRRGREEFHVGGRRERHARVALGHHSSAPDLHDFDARLGVAGHVAVDERCEPLLERDAARGLDRSRSRLRLARGASLSLCRGRAISAHNRDDESGNHRDCARPPRRHPCCDLSARRIVQYRCYSRLVYGCGNARRRRSRRAAGQRRRSVVRISSRE